ncbi:hypothetical protein Efla_000076 [Eimeria flavescens]
MASTDSENPPLASLSSLSSEFANADSYFLRRGQQLAASLGVSSSSASARGVEGEECKGKERPFSARSLKRLHGEIFASPFKEELAKKESNLAKEFKALFAQARSSSTHAKQSSNLGFPTALIASNTNKQTDKRRSKRLSGEEEIEGGLVSEDAKSMRSTVSSQKRHLAALQEQLQQQQHCIQQQQQQLQQQQAAAAAASSLIAQQQQKLHALSAEAAAAAAAKQQLEERLQQQQQRTAELEQMLDKHLARSKETAAVHQRDYEELQQLRRQQRNFARRVREEKSGEAAAKEAAAAASQAAETRKVARQRDALVALVKKLFRLVDVLKQQKAHLEAARCLQFTEDEFLKAIQAGARHSKQKQRQRQQQQQQQHDEQLQQEQQQQREQLQPLKEVSMEDN